MNYLKGSFAVTVGGDDYAKGWERIFGPKQIVGHDFVQDGETMRCGCGASVEGPTKPETFDGVLVCPLKSGKVVCAACGCEIDLPNSPSEYTCGACTEAIMYGPGDDVAAT